MGKITRLQKNCVTQVTWETEKDNPVCFTLTDTEFEKFYQNNKGQTWVHLKMIAVIFGSIMVNTLVFN